MLRILFICAGILLLMLARVAGDEGSENHIDWIYFHSEGRDEGWGLYRIQPDGTRMEFLTGENTYGSLRTAARNPRVLAIASYSESGRLFDSFTLEEKAVLNLDSLGLSDDRLAIIGLMPDGRRYILIGSYDRRASSQGGWRHHHLYLVDVDGSNPVEIPIPDKVAVRNITWTTDGRYIWMRLYFSEYQVGYLFRYDVATGILRRHDVAFEPRALDRYNAMLSIIEPYTVNIHTVNDIHVSPDGRWLAYTLRESLDWETRYYHTEVIPVNGGGARRLHTSEASPVTLDWSPDSNWLLLSEYNMDCNIVTMHRNGGSVQTVGTVACYHHALPSPRWAMNSEWVLYADTYASTNIHLAPRDGSQPALDLTTGDVRDYSPVHIEWGGFERSQVLWQAGGVVLILVGVLLTGFRPLRRFIRG